MDFLNTEVEREYLRWCGLIGGDDPYASRDTVGLNQVLKAHFLIVDFFAQEGEGVGGVGPKSVDLLHSAIYRQFVSFGGKDKWSTSLEKCATLLFGLVKDHPFHDANKRTAFLVTLLQLERLGRVPRIKQRELEDFVVEVADNQLQKYARFRDAKDETDDPEIRFIADFLKRNTRDIDRRSYTVTFHELNQIIKKHGFELVSPSGNFINLVQVEFKPKILGILGPKIRRETRLAQIGFPGWKKQVGKGALKTVRDATRLTAENGYDSKTFFQGADPLHVLIDTYAEPLRRLADR